MKYFQHRDTDGFGWADKTEQEVSDVVDPDTGIAAGYSVGSLWFDIISTILLNRTLTLLPCLADITKALSMPPLDEDEDFQITCFDHMALWARRAFDAAKKKDSDFKKPMLQLRSMQKVPFVVEGESRRVMRALSMTTFNWMMAPLNRNTDKVQKRFLKAVLVEVAQVLAYRKDLLFDYPDLGYLRDTLLTIVKQTPGLSGFSYWYRVTSVAQETPQEQYADEDVPQRVALAQSQKQAIALDAHLNKFYQSLAKEGWVGIKLPQEEGSKKPDTYALPPYLKMYFERSHRVSCLSLYL